jgi:hypothetical protein|tara:strand:- start:7864 stop:8676 length:813 start_codon:yes stop_codon:yes gene_type:complete
MYVIKASGEKEEFKSKKVLGTLLRAGASKKLAGEIVKKVEAKVYDGIKTRVILDTALDLLKNKKPEVGALYDLKRAIMELGPTGFPFERFFAEILKNYGYQTQVGKMVRGKAISQEVDVIAKKDSTYMVECKFHNSVGIYTNLKVALYTYARFLDLKKSFDSPWLATNTRLSRKAVSYAKAVNMKITSWQYPKGESLQKLIQNKKLYPITILKSVDKSVKHKLSNSGIILVKNLLDYDLQKLKTKTKLQENILKKVIDEARKIYDVKIRK